MTEKEFEKNLKKVNDVEAKIKKLEDSTIDIDMKIFEYLSNKFETSEQYNKWRNKNKVTDFIHLLMLSHYINKKKN
jgi:hypothetical protein